MQDLSPKMAMPSFSPARGFYGGATSSPAAGSEAGSAVRAEGTRVSGDRMLVLS